MKRNCYFMLPIEGIEEPWPDRCSKLISFSCSPIYFYLIHWYLRGLSNSNTRTLNLIQIQSWTFSFSFKSPPLTPFRDSHYSCSSNTLQISAYWCLWFRFSIMLACLMIMLKTCIRQSCFHFFIFCVLLPLNPSSSQFYGSL